MLLIDGAVTITAIARVNIASPRALWADDFRLPFERRTLRHVK